MLCFDQSAIGDLLGEDYSLVTIIEGSLQSQPDFFPRRIELSQVRLRYLRCKSIPANLRSPLNRQSQQHVQRGTAVGRIAIMEFLDKTGREYSVLFPTVRTGLRPGYFRLEMLLANFSISALNRCGSSTKIAWPASGKTSISVPGRFF